MKVSHFKAFHEKSNFPRKSTLRKSIRKVSSMKKINNKNEILRTLTVGQFFEQAHKDIKITRKKHIVKSVLKNSKSKLNQKLEKVRNIINKNINKDEILLLIDKNDISSEQIHIYQDICEQALERLFNEKMKKIFELRQNMSEEIRSSKGTNFDSYDEISFGSIPDKNKELLDSEYDIKFDEIFFQYLRKFNQTNNCKKIISIYMRSIYDNLLSKINSVLNPINHKRVKFKSNSSE